MIGVEDSYAGMVQSSRRRANSSSQTKFKFSKFKLPDKLEEIYLPPSHRQNSLPKIIAPHRLSVSVVRSALCMDLP